ncbi:MAG: class I SAM-dependent methyltransferase [Candidatus Cloacimonadia bacterium]
MEYEPLKRKLNNIIRMFPQLRAPFYKGLDLFILRQWYVKKELKKYVAKLDQINFYDAGSGFGQYSEYVLKIAPQAKVLAVDIDREGVEIFEEYAQNRWKNRVTAVSADLQAYVPKDKYNLFIAIDILEHIEFDVEVLQNLRYAAEDNGILIISTPYRTKEAEFTAEHFRDGYTKEELEKKLTKSGWKVKESYFSYGVWGNLAWHLSMKNSLNMIKNKLWLLLPVYLVLIMPVSLLLMGLDYFWQNRKGNGLIVVAEAV